MRNLGLIVALWLAVLLPTNSFALGLGEIEVNSFLNQPLNAEIEVISARPGEIDDLLVSLASREAFTRAGLARTRNLSELRFSVKKNEEGDQAVVLVTTKGSVKEPFLNFLIEADWSKGRVLREFTIFLDPPFYADQPAATGISSQPVEQPVIEEASVSEIVEQSGVTPIAESSEPAETEPAETIETISEPIALAEDTEPEPAQPEPASDAYAAAETQNMIEGDVSVAKGDTLWSIASGYKDQDHSMAQVMLAFQRANPGAFNDGNINNMKVGAVLRAPSAEELNAIGQQEAYAEVLVQNGLWDEYVARVTGVSPAVASEDGGAEVAAQEDGAEAEGELSLLLPGEGETESTGIGDTGDADALRTRLAIAEEELDAARIENQELESRIAELQARLSKVEELQKMVEIEDDSLAQMQAEQSETAEAMEQVEEQAATESVSDAIEADEEALLEELLAGEAAAQAEEQAVVEGSDDAMTDAAADETMADDTMADEAATETASTDGMMTEEAEAETTAPSPAPVIVTEPVTRAPSIFDGILPPDVIDMIPSMGGILNDPIILGAVGGVIILLLILIILKRRKSSSDDDTGISASSDEDLFASDEEEELTPIHLADGGVDVVEPDETDIKIPTDDDVAPAQAEAEPQDDLAATAIISAVDMPEPEAAAPASATAEQDDVLNEVDVYLAYGLYDNAEDLLNSSLTENPDRADYRSKLLDTYFATKSVDAFAKEADKLKSMGDAASGYWDRVQIMGYELAPDNPLFSDAKDSGLSAADLEITKPQEADFDLGASEDDDTNFSTTDFNLGEDDTGGDFSDTSNLGEAGEIADTQQIPQLDELPELDDDDTDFGAEALPDALAEAQVDTALELPDEVGDELEFSMDAEPGSSASAEEEAIVTDDVDMDDIAMEFDIAEEEAAAVDDKSEVDFGAEFEEALEEAGDLELDDSEVIPFEPDLTDSTAAAMEIDDDAVELNRTAEDETGFTDTAVVPPGSDDQDDDSIDLGMEDTALIDLDGDDTSLATAELNLDTAELAMAAGDGEFDDDEDISIIDFGGEDFIEPTDVVESINATDDSISMDVDIDDDDDVQTGTFAPGDFEEPTAAVDPVSDIDDIGDLMLPDDVDEVSTKLDLARAFIDMGDTEGARGSLEEVISEGNEEQKAEAKSLLEQI